MFGQETKVFVSRPRGVSDHQINRCGCKKIGLTGQKSFHYLFTSGHIISILSLQGQLMEEGTVAPAVFKLLQLSVILFGGIKGILHHVNESFGSIAAAYDA